MKRTAFMLKLTVYNYWRDAVMIPIWPSLIIVQMVVQQKFKIDTV